MHHFGENIPLSPHVINMIVLDYGILPHHFHCKNPIAIAITTTTPTLHPHLKNLPKRALTNHPHNLEIPRPNLLHPLNSTILHHPINPISTKNTPANLLTGSVFHIVISSIIRGRIAELLPLVLLKGGEGLGERETGRRAHEGVGAVVYNLRVAEEERGGGRRRVGGSWAEEVGEIEILGGILGGGSGWWDVEVGEPRG